MGDPRGAEEYLEHAEAALERIPRVQSGAARKSIRVMIGAGHAVVFIMQGDAARAIPQAQAALDGLDDADIRARSLAGIALGLAQMSQGAVGKAAEAFSGVTAANRAMTNGLFILLAAVGEESAHRMAGALEPACATYEQALGWSTDPSHPSLLVGSLHTGLVDILRERNALEAARDQATQGMKLARDLGTAGAERRVEWHTCNVLVLARIKQAQGDLDGAIGLTRAVQEQLKGVTASSFAPILAAFEAQLQIARGDLEAESRRLQRAEIHQAPPRPGLIPQFFVYAAEHLDIAPIQVLIAQGRVSCDPIPIHQALVLLDPLHERAERSELAWLKVKTLTL